MIVQRLALHQNRVEIRQQFNDAIRTSLTTLYDDIQRRATSPVAQRQTQPGSQGKLSKDFERTYKNIERTERTLKEH